MQTLSGYYYIVGWFHGLMFTVIVLTMTTYYYFGWQETSMANAAKKSATKKHKYFIQRKKILRIISNYLAERIHQK